MTILLGIDTGGTYTDAVLLDDGRNGPEAVVAKAKALTTKHDLATGIGKAVGAVVADAGVDAAEIGLVSLSTTLATNALIEGQGDRVALIAIGFGPRDLQRAGLAEALGADPVVFLPGGYTTHGMEAAPLDMTALEERLAGLATEVSGFAVAGYFAVRNPAQEIAVRDLLTERTGRPVTCSHELSARLNGPKRALTTVLNARLIGMIERLNAATRSVLETQGIAAPLMIVKGDGALVSAGFAETRPIETILSGPAASLVGGRYLSGRADAFVNDIGGTTSDVALLAGGAPGLDPNGALVGSYRTMVEAVAMHTFGLGGDSQVRLGGSATRPQIELGPRRVVPIALLADLHPRVVHAALDAQLASSLAGRLDGRFALRGGSTQEAGLSPSEARLLARLTRDPQPLAALLKGQAEEAVLARLVARGLAATGGLTPSDAQHVLGAQTGWDGAAARKALLLFGRAKDGAGRPICPEPETLARWIVRRVERRSAEAVLETALSTGGGDPTLAHHVLVAGLFDRRHRDRTGSGYVQFDLTLDRPLIGLGASAHLYHPAAAALLGVEAVIPPHADVANAIGAVVGQVCAKATVTVTQPEEGRYRVTGLEPSCADEAAAFAAARTMAGDQAVALAGRSGIVEYDLAITSKVKRAPVEGRDMLIEAVFTAIASGRPPIAVQEARDGSTPGNQS